MINAKGKSRLTHRIAFLKHIETIEKLLREGHSGSHIWKMLVEDEGLEMSYPQFMRYVQKYGLMDSENKFIPNNWVKEQTYIHLK